MWKKILVGVIVLGTVGTAGAWMLGYFSEDPALAGVRDLQAKLADENLKDEDRRAIFQQMRTQMEALSPDVRRTIWEGGRQQFEQRFDARIDQILAMAPTERIKALDEEIKRDEQRRKERAQRQNDGGGQGGNGANAGPPGGRRGQNLSDEQRNQRTRSRLERSTPEQRAKREMFRRLMEDRRKQLGLAPGGGPGRGFGRG